MSERLDELYWELKVRDGEALAAAQRLQAGMRETVRVGQEASRAIEGGISTGARRGSEAAMAAWKTGVQQLIEEARRAGSAIPKEMLDGAAAAAGGAAQAASEAAAAHRRADGDAAKDAARRTAADVEAEWRASNARMREENRLQAEQLARDRAQASSGDLPPLEPFSWGSGNGARTAGEEAGREYGAGWQSAIEDTISDQRRPVEAARAAAIASADALEETFQRNLADSKEERFRDFIDDDEMRRRGEEAAAEFNKAILDQIEDLAVDGALDDGTFRALVGRLKNEGLKAGRSMGDGVKEGLHERVAAALEGVYQQRVGGARLDRESGRITPAEMDRQARAAATEFNRRLAQHINRNRDQLSPAEFQALTSKFKAVGGEAADRFGDGFAGTLRRVLQVALIGAVAYGARVIFDGVRRAIQGIDALLSRGSDVARLGRGFDELAMKVGSTGTAMLQALRQGSRGMVSDMDLMQQAAVALNAELPVTNTQLAEMVEVSRRLAEVSVANGKAMTQQEAFQRLVSGIAKGEQNVLEELGIMVRLGDVVKGNASKMDQASKIALFYNAVMDEARRKVASLGPEIMDAGKRLDQLAAFWSNLKDRTFEAIAESPRIVSFLDEMGSGAESAATNVERLADAIASWVDTLLDLGAVKDEMGGVWGMLTATPADFEAAWGRVQQGHMTRREGVRQARGASTGEEAEQGAASTQAEIERLDRARRAAQLSADQAAAEVLRLTGRDVGRWDGVSGTQRWGTPLGDAVAQYQEQMALAEDLSERIETQGEIFAAYVGRYHQLNRDRAADGRPAGTTPTDKKADSARRWLDDRAAEAEVARSFSGPGGAPFLSLDEMPSKLRDSVSAAVQLNAEIRELNAKLAEAQRPATAQEEEELRRLEERRDAALARARQVAANPENLVPEDLRASRERIDELTDSYRRLGEMGVASLVDVPEQFAEVAGAAAQAEEQIRRIQDEIDALLLTDPALGPEDVERLERAQALQAAYQAQVDELARQADALIPLRGILDEIQGVTGALFEGLDASAVELVQQAVTKLGFSAQKVRVAEEALWDARQRHGEHSAEAKEAERTLTSARESARRVVLSMIDAVRASNATDQQKLRIIALLRRELDGLAGDVRNATGAWDRWATVADDVAQVTRSIAGLGRQLGILSEEQEQAIEGFAEMAEGAAQVATAFAQKDAVGMILGTVKLIQGGVKAVQSLTGESEAERANRRAMENLTAALDELRETILQDVSSDTVTADQSAIDRAASAMAGDGDTYAGGIGSGGGPARRAALARAAVSMGLADAGDSKQAQIDALARWAAELDRKYGTNLVEFITNSDSAGFLRALRSLSAQLGEELGELGQFTDDFAGTLARIRFEMAALGETTGEVWRFLEALKASGVNLGEFADELAELATLDLSTQAGRDRRDQIIAEMIALLNAGGVDLGGLTAEQIRELITMIAQAETGAGGVVGGGSTRLSVGITEMQGNVLLQHQATQTLYQSYLPRIWEALSGQPLGYTPPPLTPPPAPRTSPYAQGMTITLRADGPLVSIPIEMAGVSSEVRAAIQDTGRRLSERTPEELAAAFRARGLPPPRLVAP